MIRELKMSEFVLVSCFTCGFQLSVTRPESPVHDSSSKRDLTPFSVQRTVHAEVFLPCIDSDDRQILDVRVYRHYHNPTSKSDDLL
ncbi:hypothetical protein D3C80_1726190 [compost metagenome]